MNKLLIIVSIFASLSAFSQTKIIDLKETQIFTFPVIIDTFNYKTTIKATSKLGEANYLPFYFGKKRDTIYVNYNFPKFGSPPATALVVETKDEKTLLKNKLNNEFNAERQKGFDEYFIEYPSEEIILNDSAIIDIKVDASSTIRNIDLSTFQDLTYSFTAYPVIIENNSYNHVKIGAGAYLNLILEAKNQYGHWQSIEKHFKYGCGFGLRTIVLPSNEVALTSVQVFQGEFETQFRLRLGKNYSNVFTGYINLNQFEGAIKED